MLFCAFNYMRVVDSKHSIKLSRYPERAEGKIEKEVNKITMTQLMYLLC